MKPGEIHITLTTDQRDYAAVEVFVGDKSLCSSVSHSPKEAYEKVIRKLAVTGQLMYRLLPEKERARLVKDVPSMKFEGGGR